MKDRSQWITVGTAMLAIAGILVIGLLNSGELFLIAEGSEAPPFAAADVATGETLNLEAYEGKVILLNIWATNCPPCVHEMPSLQRLHEAMADTDDFVIVAVSTDLTSREHVLDWINERDLTFEVLHDRSGKVERDYQTTGLPETFIIDRSGVIIRNVIGAREWDDAVERALIDRALRLHAV
jgi:cytochrome c biogenesis protein CcmG/thiol:disulfide interchange protein DsbE